MTPRSAETLLPHHRATLDRAVERFQLDPAVEAVLVGGSIAKGLERPSSDVDLMVVLESDAYEGRRSASRVSEVLFQLADYEGGYVDVKYADRRFLEDAADHGSEPTRDSFKGTFVAWGRIEGLPELLEAIPVYPEGVREEKIRRFLSQALLQRFFLREAKKRNDAFLTGHAKSQMVLFAGRTVLAHNRILFPSAKRLLERVEAAPDKPVDWTERVTALLEPGDGVEAGEALMASLAEWHDFGIDWATALGLYVEDSEFNWRDGRPPLSDW